VKATQDTRPGFIGFLRRRRRLWVVWAAFIMLLLASMEFFDVGSSVVPLIFGER